MKIGRRFTSPCNKVCKRGAGEASTLWSARVAPPRSKRSASDWPMAGVAAVRVGAARVACWHVCELCLREWHRQGLSAVRVIGQWICAANKIAPRVKPESISGLGRIAGVRRECSRMGEAAPPNGMRWCRTRVSASCCSSACRPAGLPDASHPRGEPYGDKLSSSSRLERSPPYWPPLKATRWM